MNNTFKTSLLMAAMAGIFMAAGFLIGGVNGMWIAFGIAALMNFFAYWNADKIVLRMYRAQPVAEDSDFYQLVKELVQRARMPMPKVYIIDSPQPNAFATGRNPQNAAVAATTGLLEMLCRREIAGVMAHELAHIQNRDTLTMTMTATLAGAISMLANMAFFTGLREEGRGGPIAAIMLLILAPLAATLVQLAISRTREYSADAGGAEISGDPEALASALEKIEQIVHQVPNRTAERIPASGQLFIINPLMHQRADNLFATHPSTKNRISKLLALKTRVSPASVNSQSRWTATAAATKRQSTLQSWQKPQRPQTQVMSTKKNKGPWD